MVKKEIGSGQSVDLLLYIHSVILLAWTVGLLCICVCIVICISSLTYEQSLVFAHGLHIIRVCVFLLFIENNLISQILDLVVVGGVGSQYSEGK